MEALRPMEVSHHLSSTHQQQLETSAAQQDYEFETSVPGAKAQAILKRYVRDVTKKQRKSGLGRSIRLEQRLEASDTDRAAARLAKLGRRKEAVLEILCNLFHDDNTTDKIPYTRELAEKARSLNISPGTLLGEAVRELERTKQDVILDRSGRISNAREIGPHFFQIISLLSHLVDVRILDSSHSGADAHLPLSPSYRKEIAELTRGGHCAVLMFTHRPPRPAIEEIEEVTGSQLGGIWQLWARPGIRDSLDLSPALRSYLDRATVRVLVTGHNDDLTKRAEHINNEIERAGNLEDIHWIRVVHGIAKHQYRESLKEAMTVCVPLVLGINFVHHAFPHLVHRFVGAMDDVAGLIPNLWNDVKTQLRKPQASPQTNAAKERLTRLARSLWTITSVSAVTISSAYALGTLSSEMMKSAPSLEMKVAAGVVFAFSCTMGAIVASSAAALNTARSLRRLTGEESCRDEVRRLTKLDRAKIILQEAVLGVPFRVGQVVIGIPLQIALGAAAGAFNFFQAGWFLTFEAVAENLFGALVALSYPKFSELVHYSRLRKIGCRKMNETRGKTCS